MCLMSAVDYVTRNIMIYCENAQSCNVMTVINSETIKLCYVIFLAGRVPRLAGMRHGSKTQLSHARNVGRSCVQIRKRIGKEEGHQPATVQCFPPTAKTKTMTELIMKLL